MIDAIEYVTDGGTLAADKLVNVRNAWHLKSVSGNGTPPLSAIGAATFGLPGKSWGGVSVDSRQVTLELYADAYGPHGLQEMLEAISPIVSAGASSLGVLRLVNSNGRAYRIPARALSFDAASMRRRSALFQAVLECPQPFFEDDATTRTRIVPMGGGREWPAEWPAEWANATHSNVYRAEYAHTLVNGGDIATPVRVEVSATSVTSVTLSNATTGASIAVTSLPSGTTGLVIDTDYDGPRVTFPDGTDASAYASPASGVSDFMLAPGDNEVSVLVAGSGIGANVGTIEYRGRYTTCL